MSWIIKVRDLSQAVVTSRPVVKHWVVSIVQQSLENGEQQDQWQNVNIVVRFVFQLRASRTGGTVKKSLNSCDDYAEEQVNLA